MNRVNRLIQWDPFHLRVDADAVTALVREQMPAATVTFGDGFLAIAAGPLRARATLEVTPQRDVRLAIAVNDAPPGVVIIITLASLLPPFVDVAIAGAEIRKEGVIVSLAAGGADPPPK